MKRRTTLTATFRLPFDPLAITNTTWQRKRPPKLVQRPSLNVWLPTLDNLRNFLVAFGGKLSELQVLFSSQ